MDENTSFLVGGGAGTFGLSTAYHLAKRGYTNITCIDRWEFPSQSSAGFDRNKIVRTEYADAIYTKIAHEAIDLWRQPPFNEAFHETGWVYGTPAPRATENGRLEFATNSVCAHGALDQALAHTQKFGDTSRIEDLPTPESLRQRFPGVFDNTPGFRGIYNKNAGWVEAANALKLVGEECVRMGVKFVSGASGTAKEVLREDGEVVGVLAEDGTVHRADRVILALGAYSDSVVDMEGQVIACAYSVTHVQLRPAEVERYKDMPVVYIEGYGYTFPPDASGIIKFCDLHPGHPHHHTLPGRPNPVSIPVTQRTTLPIRYQTKISQSAFDFNWIISPHPSSSKLHIATGGSGHSFKNLPNIGKYIVDSLEGKLSDEHREAWRWRPDKIATVPHPGRVDLANLHGWQHD